MTPSQPWKKLVRARPALWSATTETSDPHWQQVKATGDTRTAPSSSTRISILLAQYPLQTRALATIARAPKALTRPRTLVAALEQPHDLPPYDFRRYTLMPGLISPLSASGTGTIAGMKRPYEDMSVPTYGQPHPKKRKVVHHLRHRQPVAHLVEPLGGGFGAADDQGFIETQLRRAIAIQCKGIGFASARPEAIEALTGLVHECTA